MMEQFNKIKLSQNKKAASTTPSSINDSKL